jgi:hypothetical protein
MLEQKSVGMKLEGGADMHGPHDSEARQSGSHPRPYDSVMVEKKKGGRKWAERNECGGGPTRERGRLGSFGWAARVGVEMGQK